MMSSLLTISLLGLAIADDSSASVTESQLLLTQAAEQLQAKELQQAEATLESANKILDSVKGKARGLETLRAETDVYLAIVKVKSANFFTKARGFLELDAAAKAFNGQWQSVLDGEVQATDEERSVLAETLGRFSKLAPHLLEDLPVPVRQYFRGAMNDGGVIFHHSHFHIAERSYRTALLAENLSTSKKTSHRASIYSNLGNLYLKAGFLHLADEFQQKSVAERTGLNSNPEDQIIASINSGAIKHELGDLTEAMQHYEQALLLGETIKAGNPELFVNAALHAAQIYSEQHKPVAALACTRDLLDLLPPESPRRGWVLNDRAAYLADAGQMEAAISTITLAIENDAQTYPVATYPSGHISQASTLALAASIFLRAGKYSEAEAHIDRAIEIFGRLAEQGHSLGLHRAAPDAYATKCSIHLQQNQSAAAREAAFTGLRIATKHIVRYALEGPAENAIQYAETFPKLANQILQFTDLAPPDEVYRAVWESKAVLARTIRLRSRVRATKSIAERNRVKKELEDRAFTNDAPADLAEQLPARSAFVDFIRRSSETGEAPDDYLAFILESGGRTTVINLGDAKKIEDTATSFIDSIRRRSPNVYEQAEALRSSLWTRIDTTLSDKSINVVFIANDGVLRNVPWEALAGREPEQYLIQDFQIAYTQSGQLLLDSLRQQTDKAKLPERMLLIGGLVYGPVKSQRDFPPVATHLPQVLDGLVPTLNFLEGSRATREETQSLLDQNEAAHFSTHVVSEDNARPKLRYAASRVILSNANIDNQAALWGTDIAFGKFTKLRFVNVGACRSGEESSGSYEPGFTSIQDAFHIAGVPSSIGSLWEVDETMTDALAASFYERLLQGDRFDPAAALRSAKIEFMKNGPGADSNHPYHWAAWRYFGAAFGMPIEAAIASSELPADNKGHQSELAGLVCTAALALLVLAGWRRKSRSN